MRYVIEGFQREADLATASERLAARTRRRGSANAIG